MWKLLSWSEKTICGIVPYFFAAKKCLSQKYFSTANSFAGRMRNREEQRKNLQRYRLMPLKHNYRVHDFAALVSAVPESKNEKNTLLIESSPYMFTQHRTACNMFYLLCITWQIAKFFMENYFPRQCETKSEYARMYVDVCTPTHLTQTGKFKQVKQKVGPKKIR